MIREVRERADDLPWPTDVRVDVRDMAHLMTNSDLMIGAAGSTTWESSCLGLPSIVIAVAENQQLIARALAHAGAARSSTVSTVTDDINWFFEANGVHPL